MPPLDKIYEVADKLLALRDERANCGQRIEEIDLETMGLLKLARELLADAVEAGEVRIEQHSSGNGKPASYEAVPTPENLTKSSIRNQVIGYFRDRKDHQITTEQIGNALASIKRQTLFWTLAHLRADGLLEA